ncbi:MAG: cytochrome C [Candidatus Binataceae bacterium]
MKKLVPSIFTAALVAVTLACGVGPANAQLFLSSRAKIGYKINPVSPLNLSHKDPNLVGLGSYWVNAMAGCNDCHSAAPYASGGNPFLGQPKKINSATYLNGGMCFGPFESRNITPDTNGLPAGLTLKEFINVIRTGDDPEDPGTLLQVMPWPDFQNLTNRDLTAIYSYLSAIPSLPTPDVTCVP